MKKKWRMVLLSGAVLTVAACGPQEDGDVGESASGTSADKLVIWEDAEKAIGIEKAVAAFEDMHGIEIEVIEKEYGGQLEDLRLDGPAGSGPDVLTIPHDQIGTAVVEGLLAPLEVDDEVTGRFTEESLLSQMVDGEVYGLPKAVETTILFYNKELVDEPPQTLDEWYELSKERVAEGEYGFVAKWDEIYYAMSVIGGGGGYIFPQNEDGQYDVNDIGLANEGAIEGGTYIQTFFEEGLFPAGIVGEQGTNVLDSLFTEGKAVAVISGPWSFEPYARAGIDYGVLPLPALAEGEPMSSFLGVKSYNVSSYSQNAELAQEFVEFLTNEENSLDRFEQTREIPPLTSLTDHPAIAEDEDAAAVSEQSLYATMTPNNPEMAEVWTPIDNALGLIATGRTDVREALEEAVQTIESQIEANHSQN